MNPWAIRVVKLRRKAASTTFPDEADTAYRLADKLCAKFNITEDDLYDVEHLYDGMREAVIYTWQEHVRTETYVRHEYTNQSVSNAPRVHYPQSEANAVRERSLWDSLRLDPRLR